jgi:hypothetical protein
MKPVLVISERDNVATALMELEPGRLVSGQGWRVTVAEPVPPGHKIAIRFIASGEPVVKYGSPIGTATADIPVGAHVHTHNLSSSRGRGDLAALHPIGSAPGARLAEPPDDRVTLDAAIRPLDTAGDRHG